MDYKKAGVDIDKAEMALEEVKDVLSENSGLYGGVFGLKDHIKNMKDPVLVSTTDGIGSKLELIAEFERWDIAAQDIVAMNLNDLVCMGAKPLFFLDYYATDKLNPKNLTAFIRELGKILDSLNCKLVGGETAELNGIFAKGKMDIGGFAVGLADKEKILKKDNVKSGDVLVGLESNGFHSNGFSLIRALIKEGKLDKKIEIIKPTKLYVEQTLKVKEHISAAAHITGGGIAGNLKRVIPKGLKAMIECPKEINGYFKTVIEARIDVNESFRVFNMGVGMIYVVPNKNLDTVFTILRDMGESPFILGRVIESKGEKRVKIKAKFKGRMVNI
jgi:phosphoribosylformylglycinamidine cyclo-ligase